VAINRASIPKEIKMAKEKKKDKKKKDKKWIQKAIKRPGALRKKAGVKKGENIPVRWLRKAAKSKDPRTRKQAQLALTFKKMRGRA
jgi:hypothetical protein